MIGNVDKITLLHCTLCLKKSGGGGGGGRGIAHSEGKSEGQEKYLAETATTIN